MSMRHPAPQISGRALLPLVGALLWLGVSPWVPHAAAEDLVLELYRLSGAQDQLKQYPRAFEVAMIEGREDTPPRIYRAVEAALKETVDSTRLDSIFLARLRGALSETTTNAALRFLRSPTGRTITEAERSASAPGAMSRVVAYFKEQGLTEADPSRHDLLRILDTVTGASDLVANQNLAIQHAIAVAFDAARSPEERKGPDVLWTLIENGQAQARHEARQQTMAFFLYTYRAISKSELREYIDFAISESGLDYHRSFTNVFMQTFAELNREMATVIAREMLVE